MVRYTIRDLIQAVFFMCLRELEETRIWGKEIRKSCTKQRGERDEESAYPRDEEEAERENP